MDIETRVKLAVYSLTAEAASVPPMEQVAARIGASVGEVRRGYDHLRSNRVLVLEPDGVTIRMAPPFSGVPTQHRVLVAGKEFFANCAWDALGILAALHEAGEVRSRCEQSGEPLRVPVSLQGPAPVPCVIHFAVPAAHWWDPIVFT